MGISILFSTISYVLSITYFSSIVHTQEFLGTQFLINMGSLVAISCFPFYLLDTCMKHVAPSEEQRIMMIK